MERRIEKLMMENERFNEEYIIRVDRYWNVSMDMGYLEDLDKAERMDKYYNFEL